MNESAIPAVSVVMTVYNGERYLEDTIRSILCQSFDDFEFLIVDDSSDDSTPALLKAWAASDSRIRILTNATNLGTGAATNRALATACGRYIAITDADDISAPDRLQRQASFLDRHTDIGVVSSRVDFMGPNREPLGRADLRPLEPALVQWTLFFRCSVAHGAAMIRRSVYEQTKGNDTAFDYAFDYAFFLYASRITRIANLPDKLVVVRVHPQSVSHRFRDRQWRHSLLAQQAALNLWLGKSVPLDVVRAMTHLHKKTTPVHAWTALKTMNDLARLFISSLASETERRQVRRNLYKQRIYLLLKMLRLPALLSRLMGGNFSKIERLADIIRY